MWFCPSDGTLLQIMKNSEGQYFFVCKTCPYHCAIEQNCQRQIKNLNKKVVDDILGGAEAWENVDRTRAVCPSCSHHMAYFMQMQIRSADEPMSVFYKCCKCGHQWNDK